MNERLKLLRKQLKLSQEEFGKRLGVGKTAISKLEKAENNITESMQLLICKEFNVSLPWLLDGVGEMFTTISEDDELAAYCGMLCAGKDHFMADVLVKYMRLHDEEKKVIREFIRSLAQKKEQD